MTRALPGFLFKFPEREMREGTPIRFRKGVLRAGLTCDLRDKHTPVSNELGKQGPQINMSGKARRIEAVRETEACLEQRPSS